MQPSHEKQRREREPDRSGHDQPFQYGHQRARRPTENAGAEPAFIAAEDRARPIAVQANRLPERAVPNIVTRKIEPEVTNAVHEKPAYREKKRHLIAPIGVLPAPTPAGQITDRRRSHDAVPVLIRVPPAGVMTRTV